ncbi:MAG: hypothetical protein Q4C13_04830, partial [Clostridia bacterium]|nr:hypothetical protein [Clostridia bacterium]
VLLIALLAKRKPGRALLSAAVFLGGMALVTLGWLIYFAAHGALSDMFQYYFIYNIFGYSGEAARSLPAVLLNIGKNTLATFYRNPQYSLLIALGVLYLSFARRAGAGGPERRSLWALCIFSAAGIYIGALGYRYYGVVLTVFACLGLVPLLRLFNRFITPQLENRRWAAALPPALLALSLALCPLLSDNAYMLGMPRSALPQYQFAAVMEAQGPEEGSGLLGYQMMDAGFYLASGMEPDFRCFTRLNIAHGEIRAEQDRYLDEGLTAFVVTRDEPLAHPGYAPIAQASYYYEEDCPVYYLYQRVE